MIKSKTKTIAAIDIGSEKVTTLIANLQTELSDMSTTINVTGVSASESGEGRGIKKGQIVNLEEAIEVVIESVESAERMAGDNITKAFVSLGGAHISSVNSHGVVAISNPEGEITHDDVNRVIEAASAVNLPATRVLVHVLPREYIVDGENGIKDPLRMGGVRLEAEAHLITASASAVKNIEKVLDEAGIKIEDFVYSGIAASDAVLSKTEKELGCVLLDIGGGTTSIAVYDEGTINYSYVLPIGSRNVTKDLATGLRVSLESAEKIKLSLHISDKRAGVDSDDQIDLTKYGIDEDKRVSRKTVVEGIIRPRLNEIFTLVGEEVKKSGFGGSTPAGAVVTGGGALTVGLATACKRCLSLPVRLGYPKGLSGLVDEIKSPAYAVAWGLIEYGVSNSKGIKADSSFKSMSKMIGKIQFKGIFEKIVKLVKSFLP